MSKIAVVYWSGTGNTKAMAEAVKSGAEEKGAEAVMLTAAEFDASMMDSFDSIAFGCAAGAVFACDSVICNEAPDDDVIADCKALGAALV